jgi:Glycine transporter
MAALLGMLTGIGGGIARDLLLAHVPMVFRAEGYAVAALAGAGVVVIGATLGLPSAIRHSPDVPEQFAVVSLDYPCAAWSKSTIIPLRGVAMRCLRPNRTMTPLRASISINRPAIRSACIELMESAGAA